MLKNKYFTIIYLQGSHIFCTRAILKHDSRNRLMFSDITIEENKGADILTKVHNTFVKFLYEILIVNIYYCRVYEYLSLLN